MLDAAVAAGLEDVGEADDVAVDVGLRVLQRVAHAGLGGEVDHALRAEIGERRVHRRAILERRTHEAETGVRGQPGKARFLERGIVIVVEVVVAEHFVAAREQAQAEGGSDEAGSTGDEDAHDSGRQWGREMRQRAMRIGVGYIRTSLPVRGSPLPAS